MGGLAAGNGPAALIRLWRARELPLDVNPTATAAPAARDDDRADVALAVAGDAQAFERLYRRHVGRINALACRMGGRQDAEELIQDAFVRAWEKLHLFRGESAFGTWLHRLAVNLIVERFRSARTRRAGLHDGGDDVIDMLPARPGRPDVKLALEAALEHVPPGAREVFVLHDVEGYRHAEIADRLGVAAGTSKAQLHRARMILRKLLT